MEIIGKLGVDPLLVNFVETELLAGADMEARDFWEAFEGIVADLRPRNTALLARRDQLQEQIDAWHLANRDAHDHDAYIDLLGEIGYLEEAPDAVEVTTSNVDPEIAEVAGPQLVVPLDNARYALNAANARWGSFYDALYGTDAIDENDGRTRSGAYNPTRGDAVVAYVRAFLDAHFPLIDASHSAATVYVVRDGALAVRYGDTETMLRDADAFVAYTGSADAPTSILLKKHGLGVIIEFDSTGPIGSRDAAGINDVHLESAVTAIMDCEDSVAAVDVADKINVYRNWLGLMTGTLTSSFTKGGETIERSLHDNRTFVAVGGGEHVEPGRAVMLVRNVGHHLTTDAVTYDGDEIPETFLDAMVTVAAALHDLTNLGRFRNSRAGSVYVVKPKMHGPDEVQLAVDLFGRVEDALGLARNTIKIGIMDEERRTSLNLKKAIAVASERVVFINTGFLDRTGDEIHTSMEAGALLLKGEMKGSTWQDAYEDANVDAGLACGLLGNAQIGKGMWAAPSNMAAMLEAKVAHPQSGASTAWVPSPTAATLHATHYFDIDVAQRQREIAGRPVRELSSLTEIPLLARDLTADEIQRELDNNVQGILGYVVRWVGQGIGCSTVPDINDVGLMEDLATLRISSQHVANWIHHGVLTEAQVRTTMERMAAAVDEQNAGDPNYTPMAPDVDRSIPFKAALALVLEGRMEPNGYTERILRRHRREMKAIASPAT